ncbi:FAD-binding protein [Pusillimonas sp. TS35]|uniref:FAD-binding oxidoreductase n=1 Tax=Paracandidimonas lactea TaxID=2895524 RepID=UPI00136C1637|nr:FAD-linked oxidase C-terminal domain-containing protein [Paracandidimonas lactea]MYN12005.1 FAD-binding protein [Pusillimonas sp. TS35]
MHHRPRRTLTPAALAAFQAQFGARFLTSDAVREHHGTDESPYPVCPPDAVIFPRDIDDVVAVVRLCGQYGVPVIPFGIGSSLEGHVLPVEGGITLDFAEMDKVLAIDAEDFTVTVQPGVTRTRLNEEIRHTGLFFPIDPGAHATIGGMAATRASGTNAVRYGTMRENVVSLKVVTADGQVVRTASRARKSSAGYDLTRLFVGSEGTLGIIVEATVRVYPQPEAITAAICNFPTLDAAVRTVIEVMQSGVAVARVEFMDERAVNAVNRYSKLALKETPLLLFEFHGSLTGVQEQAAVVQEIAHGNGGMDFEWAEKPEDRTRLWTARHNSHYSGLQLRPGSRSVATDVCVPISRLADCVTQTAVDLVAMPFPYTIVGHVGDGNFHVQMLIDPDSEHEWRLSEELNHRLVRRAIAMDGTCSGEHGVGLHKMAFLREEHGDDALQLMRLIKRAYDPGNIFNPGKLVSWA